MIYYISQLISFPTPAVKILPSQAGAFYVDFNPIDLLAIIEHTGVEINHSLDSLPLFTRALELFSRGIITQFLLISHRLLRMARLSNSFAYRFDVAVLALISEHNCLDDKWTFETATNLSNYSTLLLPALSCRFRLRRDGDEFSSARCDRLWSRNHFLSYLLFFFSAVPRLKTIFLHNDWDEIKKQEDEKSRSLRVLWGILALSRV